MAAASENDAPRFSKWHLAVIIGVGTPVALVAYWYYKKRNSKKNEKETYGASVNVDAKQTTVSSKKSSKNENSTVLETVLSKAKVAKEEGNTCFRAGQYDRAIECYSKAIEICPPESSSVLSTFYQNRAAAYESLKNYEAVIQDTTKALEHNKLYIKAAYRRAKAYEEMGDLQKCLEDLTAVCMLDAFSTDSYLKMTDKILKQLSKVEAKKDFSKREPKLPSKHFIRNFFISFSEDPIMKSVEEYKKDKKNPSELSGFRLVLHHLAEENYSEVVPSCTVEIDKKGQDMAEAYLVRGTFKLLQGQIEAALEDFTQLLSLESVDVKVHVNCLIKYGTLLVQREKMDDALQEFNKAIELDLNNADIYLHRGQVHLLMERYDDCVKDMEKSCSLNPNFPSARAQKCYIQYRCGIQFNDEKQKQSALQGFEDIEKNFPKCLECLFLYAQVLSECGDFQKAYSYFKKAGELDPQDPNVYVHQGLLTLQWKQDVNSALELLKKAVEMDDKCQFGYETLGSVEIQRGNLKKGLQLFEKAIDAAHTETELAHLYSLLLAAKAQSKIAAAYGFEANLMS